jgi:outer membrane lipoprotein carrier protein
MKNKWLYFMASLLLGLFSIPQAFGVTGQEVLIEIQKQYEKTNNFEATFVQETIGKMIKKPHRGEGKVYFQKKGMMCWDYRTPNQKLISNGKNLWFYLPDEKQVFVSNVSGVLKEKTPLAFLAGEGDLRKDFTLINFNESISQKEENFVLELAPKEPMAALAKLVLTADKKTYQVVQADVFDAMGNLTRTRFINIKTNVDLPASLFQFTVPQGTEVFNMEPSSSPPAGREPQKK